MRPFGKKTGDRFPAVGLGEELRIDTETIGGAALQLDGGLAHLFAFQRRSGHAGDAREAAR